MRGMSKLANGGMLALLALLLVAPAGVIAQPTIIVNDSFDDGDRSDGADPLDLAWWLVYKASAPNQTAVVGADLAEPTGLGEDNAFQITASGDQAYQVASLPSLVNASGPEQYIKLSFKVRLVGVIPDYRDVFRFGLFRFNSTPVIQDQPAVPTWDAGVNDDYGYFVTVATGNPSADNNRQRIAEGNSEASAGTLFGLDNDIVVENPATLRLNDNLPHTLTMMVIHTHGNTAIIKYSIDGTTLLTGEDASVVRGQFNEVGFGGVGASSMSLSYNLDDIVIETGTVPVCEAINRVTIAKPVAAGATTVKVNRIGEAVEEVRVYKNGDTLIGTWIRPVDWVAATSVEVPVDPPVAGDVITARQIIGGMETCVFGTDASAIVDNCADVGNVNVKFGIEPDDTLVTVLGVNTAASEVKVFAKHGEGPLVLIGTAPGNGTESVDVTVSPPLVRGDVISAAQVVSGVQGCEPTTGMTVPGATITVLLEDHFGDGDRDNDSWLDNPWNSGVGTPDPVADVGVPWYRVDEQASFQKLDVKPDPTGLNTGNALVFDAARTKGFQLANFQRVTLQPGESIKLTFRMRFWYPVPLYSSRDSFRFGLFTRTADDASWVRSDQDSHSAVLDDAGYVATVATGTTPLEKRIARNFGNGSAGGALFDFDYTVWSEDTTTDWVYNDHNVRVFELSIARNDETNATITYKIDGLLVKQATDSPVTLGGVVRLPLFTFDEVAFGEVATGGSRMDYMIDDVKVETTARACADPAFELIVDGKIDALDLLAFEACATGPAPAAADFLAKSMECRCLDVNKDEAIDQDDFGVFQRCFTGSDGTLNAACDD